MLHKTMAGFKKSNDMMKTTQLISITFMLWVLLVQGIALNAQENTSAIFTIPNGYRLKRTNKVTELGSGNHSIVFEKTNLHKK
jgi:hypothetical protein